MEYEPNLNSHYNGLYTKFARAFELPYWNIVGNGTDKRQGLIIQPQDVVEAIELALDEAVDAASIEEHPTARAPHVVWHGAPVNASARLGRPPMSLSRRRRWAQREGSSVHMGFAEWHNMMWSGYGTGGSPDWAQW